MTQNLHYQTTPNNFLSLSKEFSSFNNSKIVILPIPYEATTSYKTGTREAPQAIINASRQLEFYDEELGKEVYKIGIHTLEPMACEYYDPEGMSLEIERLTGQLIKENKFVVALGGEHSVTIGLVKGMQHSFKNLSVLQLDAHADLREEYFKTPYSHACVMKRIVDLSIPTVQVGIRSLCKDQAELINERRLPVYFAKDIIDTPSDLWINKVISHLTDTVYITIDLDVFDPAYVPGVGTPEPGGLDWYLVLKILKKVAETRSIIGFDVVELCPLENNISSDFLAARLIYKLIGYVHY
ncbi:MAG: agmatinase [bacterium]